jgi:streptogramin lyase
MPITAVAQQYGIIERVLQNNFVPYNGSVSALATGPDGAAWFTLSVDGGRSGYTIGRITPAGALTQYPVPMGIPTAIAAGYGDLWFPIDYATETASAIGRMTTSGVLTTYDLPEWWGQYSAGIARVGTNMWFVGPNGLGYTSSSGEMVTRQVSDIPGIVGPLVGAIAAGSDGNTWVLDNGIANCTAQFVCTNYPVPPDAFPSGATNLIAGPWPPFGSPAAALQPVAP